MKGELRDRAVECALADTFHPITGVEEAFGPAPVSYRKQPARRMAGAR